MHVHIYKCNTNINHKNDSNNSVLCYIYIYVCVEKTFVLCALVLSWNLHGAWCSLSPSLFSYFFILSVILYYCYLSSMYCVLIESIRCDLDTKLFAELAYQGYISVCNAYSRMWLLILRELVIWYQRWDFDLRLKVVPSCF